MSNVVGVVYFCLLLFITVGSNDIKEAPQEKDIQLSDQQNIEANISNTTINQDISSSVENSLSSEEIPAKFQRKSEDKSEEFDRSGKVKENEEVTEEHNRSSENSPKPTFFVGSIAKAIHDKLSNEGSEDVEGDISRIGPSENTSDNNTESGEVMIFAPPINKLSQDAVIDTKARSGRVDEEDKEDELDKDGNDHENENSFKIAHLPEGNNDDYLRAGFYSPDVVDDLKPPDHNFRSVTTPEPSAYPFNHPALHNKHHNQLPRLRYNRPESTYQNSPSLSSLIYGNAISRETIYPGYTSREIMGYPNSYLRPVTKPYYDYSNLNNQLLDHRSLEICSSCQQPKYQSQDFNTRRSTDTNQNTKETANSKTAVYNSAAANEYPLQSDNNERKVENQLHSRSYVDLDLEKHDAPNSRNQMKDVTNFPPEIGSLTKVLMSLPQYNVPRKNPFRRIGLGGMPVVFL